MTNWYQVICVWHTHTPVKQEVDDKWTDAWSRAGVWDHAAMHHFFKIVETDLAGGVFILNPEMSLDLEICENERFDRGVRFCVQVGSDTVV